ncbi:MAG: hypothetical protein WCH98_21000 [Verrucomicrobiota bacterium]
MLFLLQLALGIAFLGYLVLAVFDAIRGMYYILTGLGLLAFGLTLKGVAILLRKIHPAPPVVTPAVRTWKVIAP